MEGGTEWVAYSTLKPAQPAAATSPAPAATPQPAASTTPVSQSAVATSPTSSAATAEPLWASQLSQKLEKLNGTMERLIVSLEKSRPAACPLRPPPPPPCTRKKSVSTPLPSPASRPPAQPLPPCPQESRSPPPAPPQPPPSPPSPSPPTPKNPPSPFPPSARSPAPLLLVLPNPALSPNRPALFRPPPPLPPRATSSPNSSKNNPPAFHFPLSTETRQGDPSSRPPCRFPYPFFVCPASFCAFFAALAVCRSSELRRPSPSLSNLAIISFRLVSIAARRSAFSLSLNLPSPSLSY